MKPRFERKKYQSKQGKRFTQITSGNYQAGKSGVSRRKIKDQPGLRGARYEIVRRVLDEEGLLDCQFSVPDLILYANIRLIF